MQKGPLGIVILILGIVILILRIVILKGGMLGAQTAQPSLYLDGQKKYKEVVPE